MPSLSNESVKLTFSHYWDKVASDVIDYCLKHCDECGRVEFTFQDFACICGYSAEFLEDDYIDIMDYIDGLRFKAEDGSERADCQYTGQRRKVLSGFKSKIIKVKRYGIKVFSQWQQ